MADKLVILQFPDERLRQKCKPVDKVTPELVTIAKDMYAIMRENNGIGLAAPQVGLDIALVVMEDNGPLFLFNPVILKRSPDLEYAGEACLSFKGVTRIIKRPKEVTIKYRDENNKMSYGVFKDLQARCIIHEISHLQGVLFIDLEEKK